MTDEQYNAARDIQEEITELTELLDGDIHVIEYKNGNKITHLYPSEALQDDLERIISDRVEFLKKRFSEL